jgi:flagella basal body P-ring formation protein FlgA
MFRANTFLSLPLAIAVSCAAQAANPAPGAQDPAAVVRQVQRFLTQKAGAWPGTPKIVVDTPDTDQFTACSQLQVFERGQLRLRSRLSVGVRCLAPQPWTTYVQASVSIQGVYYVASHTIAPDATIGADDLEQRSGDLLRLPRGVVLDPARLIGYVARQRIRVGQTIKARSIRSPESIQRGQTVRTVARGHGFTASSSGTALESAPPGSSIQVKTASGRIITGTVVDAHTVQIAM